MPRTHTASSIRPSHAQRNPDWVASVRIASGGRDADRAEKEIDVRQPWRLGLIPVVAVVFLALVSTGAQATAGARVASPCLVQAVRPIVGKFTKRLVLRGKVSCSEAGRTYRAFLRDEDSGACGSGQICGIRQAGGWQCAFLSVVESKQDHGLEADCSRRGASFGVYSVAGKSGKARDTTAPALTSSAIVNGVFPPPATQQALVENWNGVSWTRITLPDVPTAPGTKWTFANLGAPTLSDISCRGMRATTNGRRAERRRSQTVGWRSHLRRLGEACGSGSS